MLSVSVAGQDIYIKAEYPSVVNTGDQFTVNWTVNSGGGEFTPPAFTGFNKLMGPQTSYSSSTQIINGKMSTSTTYTYVYYLQATNEGKYVISPATFKLKGKSYTSESMNIEVVGSSNKRQNTQSSSGNTTNSDNNGETSGKGNLFVNLSLSRKEVYIGEPITASIKIFTRIDISGINEIKYPSFDGFMRSDIETPSLTSLNQETVNGTVFGTGVVQQLLLFPQISGNITIDPVQLTVLVQQKSGNSDPFFGDFFSSYQTIPKVIESQPIRINVKPLPGLKPADFSGIVGSLDLSASINKDSVDVNDAVNLKINISGNGNLKIAAIPDLKLSPDIEVYDPKITDNIKNGTNGTTGQKTFEFLLIPRHYGDYTIPPVTYSFFNTSSGKYETLSTKEFHFHAKKGNDQNTGITVYGGVSKENVQYIGKDIRFIKNNLGKVTRSGNVIFTKRSFYSIYVFVLITFFIILFLRREHIKRNSDISSVKNRKAAKIAGKRLKAASECLTDNQLDKFYEEILKAMWGYLSDKLSISVSELNRNNAVASLTEKGIDEEIIKNLNNILDACEYARFSPSDSGTEAATLFDGATQFIRSVENSIS